MKPADWINLIVSIIVGGLAIYSAGTSKRVEKNIRRMLDIQSYNKNRNRMLKNINHCIQILIEDDAISLTNISVIQSSIHKLKQYPNIFTQEEKTNMGSIINSLKEEVISDTKKKVLLDSLNNLKAKLEKGDAIIDDEK